MKVLVIQQRYGIGDMVIFTPYFHAISKKCKSPITILAKKSSKAEELFLQDKSIKEVIQLNNTNDGFFGFFKLLDEIKKKKFDSVVIFNGSLRYKLLAKLAGIKSIYQYPLFISKDVIFESAKKLSEKFTNLPVKTETKLILDEINHNLKKKYIFDKEFLHILLGVSASGPTKRWDVKNFINLAKKISQIKKTKFYIAGGKNDENIISEILNSDIGKNCFSLLDHNINECMFVIKNSNFGIFNDTGFLHISAAFKKKSIGIFVDSPAYSYSGYSEFIYPVVPEGESVKSTSHNTRGKDKVKVEMVFSKVLDILN